MTATLITGRRLFLELLRQEGVRVLFGNPGTTELPLMEALSEDAPVRYVLGLQEGVVMAMADGYARASRGIAACNLHVAPGLGNAMGMLFDAQKAGSSVLVTAGQQAQGFGITEPNLYAELPEIAAHLVKYAVEARAIADLPLLIHRAVKTALAPPSGPVFVSLPVDVLRAEAEIALGMPSRVASAGLADPAEVARAAALLSGCASPVIIAGDAIDRSQCAGALVALAEALGAPVYVEGENSTLPFPPAHPLFRGPIVRLGPAIRALLARHDVLFSAGADLFTLSLPPEVAPVPEGLRIIHLDTDPWQLGKNFPTECALLGEPALTLPALTASVLAGFDDVGRARRDHRRAAVEAEIAADYRALCARAASEAGRTPVSALALMQAIGDTLPADAVVVDETISSGTGLFQFLRALPAGSLFGMRGGGIGWGLPAAIGVQLALPDRRVVALVGDGSAMYSIQALWTAAHENVPVVFVILNNRGYGILKSRAQVRNGRYVGMELGEPAISFTGLAVAMGVQAMSVRTIDGFIEALRLGLGSERPLLIEVAIG